MELLEPHSRRIFSPTIVQAEQLRLSLRRFWKSAWPNVEPAKLVWGWHLDALCDHLTYVTLGDIRFLMVNMPPRTSKSLGTSVIYPVWDWLQDATVQFLTASYDLSLSIRDTLKSRQLMESEWFQKRWGHELKFSYDEKLKRQYANNKGGRRIAIAVESRTTGEGGNKLIVDDPHNATEIESDAIRKGTHDWWDHAMTSRLNQPTKDSWIINGQRTGADDLFAHIMQTHDTGEIVRLILPNEFDPSRRCISLSPVTKKPFFIDPREKKGDLLCPERIDAATTARFRRVMKAVYEYQYQQVDSAQTGTILAKENWKLWEATELPECEVEVISIDTAFEEGEKNDYSAFTRWGIFTHPVPHEVVDKRTGKTTTITKERKCIILLGAWRDKIAYHKLKRHLRKAIRHHKPEWVLVEKKASGIVLCQDLSRAGIRGLRKVKLDHGGRTKNDKRARANLVSTVLDDGLVWYVPRKWATPVLDECAAVPHGANDDWADTCIMAWQFLRRLGEIGLWEEAEDDGTVRLFKKARRPLYG